ncbi:Carboxypeptidase regulatory-like domain protein [Calidithermus terrae]|uniref:Carboxypeptidase regulatory-like domain protein n=1 Tax=Calidithermus terrae TaxID=1408545 RepID=A0A399EDB7_9DEIN|nr:carboxypeptidase regulatory-like domain-containing protein [Calidithermus terrae]RIH81149.1 Carboxypeptidase regulatory-like domain protein [Calidithermus terrae]
MNTRIWLALCAGLLLAACGGGKPNPGGSGTVSGFVTDIGSGAKLAGVSVEGVGTAAKTTTDASGQFSLGGLAEGTVKLSFHKDGYAPGYATARTGAQEASTLVALKKEGSAQPYDPATGQTLYQMTEAGPYAVIFAAGSLATADANLRVVITPLDPTKEGQALPGQLRAGSNPLIPVTFAEFSILDSAGRRINLKPGASAIVELPIPPELRGAYPIGAKIHCYAYNPETGQWEDFVEGTVELSSVDGSTPVLRASIRHFSWYGGAPEGQKCRNGAVQVVDAGGKPLEGATVVVTPGVNGTTNAEGVASVWIAEGSPNPKMYAYKVSTNSDGRIPELPRTAKVIDIGYFVTDDLGVVLPGLVEKDCASVTASSAPVGPQSGHPGSPENPFVIRLGPVGAAVYDVEAWLLASSGQAFVQIGQGIPGEDGEIEESEPVDGARVTLLDGEGRSAVLTGLGGGSYYLEGGLSLTPGRRYTLSIDADGNGSVEGSGSLVAVGNVAWEGGLDGSTRPAQGFTARWSDPASGVSGYSPVYYAVVSNGATEPEDYDFDYYVGPAREFQPHSNALGAAEGAPLKPGDYTGSLWAFSGAFAPAGRNDFTVSNNITGVGLSGRFYSFSQAPGVTFTLTAP